MRPEVERVPGWRPGMTRAELQTLGENLREARDRFIQVVGADSLGARRFAAHLKVVRELWKVARG